MTQVFVDENGEMMLLSGGQTCKGLTRLDNQANESYSESPN